MSYHLRDLGSKRCIDRVVLQRSFLSLDTVNPHPPRRRANLKAHPEVETLVGPDPRTVVITLAVVIGQTLVAALFGRLGLTYWWLALIAAFCIGAFANHAMFVVIHDAVHNSVFIRPFWNRLVAILADLPNTIPTAMAFRCYHLKHHSHLGDYNYDADLPSHWEVSLFGRRWYWKAFWLFFFPIFQLTRLGRLKGAVPVGGRWTYINAACLLIFDLGVLTFLAPNALFYHFASFWFSLGGLHPLCGRLIQEHFIFDRAQETCDYYGPLNLVALNAGYHNEHHDFPDVAWTRLPLLRQMSPEFYNHLKSHRSWSRLLIEFIFNPRLNLIFPGRPQRDPPWGVMTPEIR